MPGCACNNESVANRRLVVLGEDPSIPGQYLTGLYGRLGFMTQNSLLRPEGLVHSPAFTHVAIVPPNATTVYIGGQNAVDSEGKIVGAGDAVAQTRKVMENLRVALAAGGVTVHDLVMITIIITEEVDLAQAYPVAAAALEGAAPPVVAARVASLGVPGALLEVSAVAAITR